MKQHRPVVSEENYEKLERYTGDNFDDRLSSLLLLKSFREQEIDNLKMDKERLEFQIRAQSRAIKAIAIIALLIGFIMVMQ